MLTHWHWWAKAGTVGKVMGIDIPTRGRYKITIAYWESPWPACAGVLLTCCPEMIFTNQQEIRRVRKVKLQAQRLKG